jgi:hypothetical protein
MRGEKLNNGTDEVLLHLAAALLAFRKTKSEIEKGEQTGCTPLFPFICKTFPRFGE